MKPVVVSEVLAVGEFPMSEQIEILAKAGFKSLLDNQPDGEVARFPAAADVEAEARRHGLAFAYAPLSSRTPPQDELARYEAALKSLPAPIYAFCYSGSRAAAACAFLLTERLAVADLVAQFQEAGFDISALRPWLEEERARRTGAPGAAAAGGSGEEASTMARAADDSAPARRPETELSPPAPVVVVLPRAASYGGFAI